jgi:glycosyltransferase involved in cell wall biosynthesis
VSTPAPLLASVIVPVRDGAKPLAESLPALRASGLPADRWELIVVDDASTDDTAEVAGPYADRVVRLAAPAHGPAYARNRGGEIARGETLVFVDADVCVHADAVSRLLEIVSSDADTVAAFGAYDTRPPAPGLVSQYRNLVHHYVHAQQPGEADTFWAGLGAVRADVFREVGGFDEVRYPRPQIEDIELGYRLRARGHRIVLDPSVQGTHLKRWTLGQVIRGDVFDRGVPWMRLLLERRSVGVGTLNIGIEERLFTVLTVVGTAALLLAMVARNPVLLAIGLGCLLGVLAGNARVLAWFARVRGARFAAAIVPLRLLYYLLNGASVALALLQRAAPGERTR